LYKNHLSQAVEQLRRDPKNFPRLAVDSNLKDIDKIEERDIVLYGYDPHPHIKAEIAV
jgi:thymidylate synthase